MHEGARARAATVARDGVAIELVELDAPRPDVASDLGRSPVRLVFAVDDLASSLQSLRDRGVDVLEESRMCFAQGVVSCFVRDPDGLLIQLYQEPRRGQAALIRASATGLRLAGWARSCDQDSNPHAQRSGRAKASRGVGAPSGLA